MFILLSYKIDDLTPAYGGQEGFLSESLSSIEKGDSANISKWELSNHLGTHIDFPHHFYQNGQTIDNFPLDFWIFKNKTMQILELDLPTDALLIKPEHTATQYVNFDAEFLLLKTGFDKYRNQEKYWKYNLGLSMEISDWIIKNFKKIRIVGLDSISISSWQHRDIGRKAHRKLLNPKNPILIIEDMDLSKVTDYTIFKRIYIAPLMISNSDGTPCTILAEVEKL